jgi:hypothetical protein
VLNSVMIVLVLLAGTSGNTKTVFDMALARTSLSAVMKILMKINIKL